jgi:hypothetical protein
LHNQGEAYGRLPSEIMHLETDWGAWQLNEITLMVGRRVEKNLNSGKDAWFGFSNQPSTMSRKLAGYRSAKGRAIKKVKIKADGTW